MSSSTPIFTTPSEMPAGTGAAAAPVRRPAMRRPQAVFYVSLSFPPFVFMALQAQPAAAERLEEIRLRLRQRRQLPASGADRADLAIHRHFDQVRPVGGDRRGQRVLHFVGARDGVRGDAEAFRQHREVRAVELPVAVELEAGRQFAPAEHAVLDVADRAVAVVVPHHPHHRDVVFHGGGQRMRRHQERAVADHRDARPVGRREFRAEDAGGGEAHRGEAPGMQQLARPQRLEQLDDPVVVHADIAGDDRVLRQRARQRAHQPLRAQRHLVGGRQPSLIVAPHLRPRRAPVSQARHFARAGDFGPRAARSATPGSPWRRRGCRSPPVLPSLSKS